MAKTGKTTTPEILESPAVAEDVQHEEVITVPQRIEKEISRFNFPKSEIKKFKRKFALIKIDGIEDKAGLKAADDARKELKNIRVAIEKKREEIKEEYLKVGRGIDAAAKELKNEVTTGAGGENDLIEKIKVVTDAIAAKAEKERQEAEEKLSTMVNTLLEAGLSFDGRFYSLKHISVDISTLRDITEERFLELVEAAKVIKAELDAEAKKDREEKERLEKEALELQAANEQKEKDLKAREDKLKEQEEAAAKNIYNGRVLLLKGIGMAFGSSGGGLGYSFKNKAGECSITETEIKNLPHDEFETRANNLKNRISEISEDFNKMVKEDEEKQQEQNRINNRNAVRRATLEGAGWKFNAEGTAAIFYSPYTDETIVEKTEYINALPDENFSPYVKDLENIKKDFLEFEKEKQDKLDAAAHDKYLASLDDIAKMEAYAGKIEKLIRSEKFPVDVKSDKIKGDALLFFNMLLKNINDYRENLKVQTVG